MTFDADAWVRSIEKPAVTIGGYTYTGRLLSIEEYSPIEAEMLANKDNKDFDWVDCYTRFLRAIYPNRYVTWWRPDPVKLIRESPAFLEVVKDFLVLHRRLHHGEQSDPKQL